MFKPNIDPMPGPDFNTMERTVPHEFLVRKYAGEQVVSQLFQVRNIEGLLQPDLDALYGFALDPVDVVRFVSKSVTNKKFDITLQRKEGRLFIEKNDTANDSYFSLGGFDTVTWDTHRIFTLDFEAGDPVYSEVSMGYDKDGDPEIVEFREATPKDLFKSDTRTDEL